MEEKYLLSDEEINEALLRSPYSLPSSPSEQGLDASTIKKYFYDFVVYLARSINKHLASVGADLGAQAAEDEAIRALLTSHNTSELAHQALISAIKSSVSALGDRLGEHTTSENAHKSVIEGAINTHDTEKGSHRDLRALIETAKSVADSALSLASGKSKVIPVETAEQMLEELALNTQTPGDVFILEEKNTPDFTYFGLVESLSEELSKGATEITFEDYANGEITLQAGNVYIFEGKKLVASESGFDVSLLARKEALSALEAELNYQYEEISKAISHLELWLESKENLFMQVASDEDMVLVESGKEYSLGLKTSLTLTLPQELEDSFFAIVSLRTGQELGEIVMPQGAIASGDDCEGGVFAPQQNRLYELSVKKVLGEIVIRVAGCDYEVI